MWIVAKMKWPVAGSTDKGQLVASRKSRKLTPAEPGYRFGIRVEARVSGTRRGRLGPMEQRIEQVFQPGKFIHDRACSAFVAGLEEVAHEIETSIAVEPVRGASVLRFRRALSDVGRDGSDKEHVVQSGVTAKGPSSENDEHRPERIVSGPGRRLVRGRTCRLENGGGAAAARAAFRTARASASTPRW